MATFVRVKGHFNFGITTGTSNVGGKCKEKSIYKVLENFPGKNLNFFTRIHDPQISNQIDAAELSAYIDALYIYSIRSKKAGRCTVRHSFICNLDDYIFGTCWFLIKIETVLLFLYSLTCNHKNRKNVSSVIYVQLTLSGVKFIIVAIPTSNM